MASKRLQQGIKDYEMRQGMEGRLRMALAAGVGEQMVRRYKNGQSSPTSAQAHSIAKCWGASDEEADLVAREFDPDHKETA